VPADLGVTRNICSKGKPLELFFAVIPRSCPASNLPQRVERKEHEDHLDERDIALIPKKPMTVLELAQLSSAVKLRLVAILIRQRAILRRLERVPLDQFSLSPVDVRSIQTECERRAAGVMRSVFK
jgi:hypothetical protein